MPSQQYLHHVEDLANCNGMCFNIGLVSHGGLCVLVPTSTSLSVVDAEGMTL